MSQEITTRAIGDTAELARPNPNPARGLTRQGGQAMDDFGSADPAGPVEMQEFSFFDFLDIINPLQHIPIVSSLYRAATGDELKPFARIIGGALFGGPSGFMRGIAEAIMVEGSGKDIGQHVAALFDIGDAAAAPVATLRLAETRTPEDPKLPAVVALGLETLADGPSEWAIARRAGTADTWPAPATEPGIAGGIADSRLIGDSEPLATPANVIAHTLDAATAARVKSFMAAKPGAPIDKATLKWLVDATPIVSAAAAAFGKPDPANPVAPPGGLSFVAVAPPGLDATIAPPRLGSAPARAVTAPSITTPSADPVAPTPVPPSLDRRLEEQQSSREPEPQRVPFASAYRGEFYEGTFRVGPRQWQSPVMIAEPRPLELTPHRTVAATDPDLPMIPMVPTTAAAPAAVGPAAPGRQLAAAGLADLPAIAVSPDPRVPAVVAVAGEPVLDRPSGLPVGAVIAIERTAAAAPPLPPQATTTVSRTANPWVAPVPTAPPPPRTDIPAPVADGPRADHDEAKIAAASAAWLRAMPMARPITAGLAELEAPALRQTMTATPAPPANPPADAAAADPGPTAMLSTELLAQVMMSNLDKYADLARRRHPGPVVNAGLN